MQAQLERGRGRPLELVPLDSLEARHFGAIVGMGLIYEALGDQEAALEAFHRGLKVNPHMSHIKKKSEQLARELKDKNI